jgi:signal transduction histidine kinase
MRVDAPSVQKPWRAIVWVLAACVAAGAARAAEPLPSVAEPLPSVAEPLPSVAEPLRSIAEILALPPDELQARQPVVIRGVVTLAEPLVIQNGDHAISLSPPASPEDGERAGPRPAMDPPPEVGAELEVSGFVDPGGRAPTVALETVRQLGMRPLPEPISLDPAQFFAGGQEYGRIKATGVVQAILDNPEGWSLIVESASRRFRVVILKRLAATRPDRLIDAEVEIVAVNVPLRNSRGKFVAPYMRIGSLDDIRTVREPPLAAFELPSVPLGSIARLRVQPPRGHRARTSGIVSFAVPGSFYLQDEAGGVRIDLTPGPETEQAFQAGDRVDVAGFPDLSSGIGGLEWAVARKISTGPAPAPVPIQPSEILRLAETSSKAWKLAQPGNYDGCLVRCAGRIEAVNASAAAAILTLLDRETAFTVALADGGGKGARGFVPGSDVEVTGIARGLHGGHRVGDIVSGNITTPSHIEVLVRDARDIRIVRLPPWWTPRRLAIALGAIAAVLGLAIAWVFFLKREVASQTRLLAHEMRSRRDAAIEFDATLRERSRLAANLHDTLLQALAGSVLQIDLCRRSLAGRRVEAVSGQLDVAKRMVKHAADDLRNSVWALRTAPLAGQSFPDSLRSLVSQLGHETPGQIRLHLDGESFPLPRFVAGNLLLVAQEAIRNALHHAEATSIDVKVRFDAPAHRVGLFVADDGSGFEWGTQLGPERGHFGLQGMRERVEAIRGRFAVETAPGRGTRVTAEVAVQPVDAAFQQEEDDHPDAAPPPPGRGNGHPPVPAQKSAAAAG